MLYTPENLELLEKIRLRYIKSEVVQGSTSDISSNCSLLESKYLFFHYYCTPGVTVKYYIQVEVGIYNT